MEKVKVEKPNEFDYSMLSCYQLCQRKFYWRHLKYLTSPDFQAAPEFGRCIHTALDAWYRTGSKEEALKAFTWDDKNSDNKRTRAVGERLIKFYVDKYRHQNLTVLATEKPFKLPIKDNTYYCGRVDKIVNWDGVIAVLDHKTTSQLNANFFTSLEPSMQFDGYIWASRQMGHPYCNTIILDALLVAKTKAECARDFKTKDSTVLENTMLKVCALIAEIQHKCESDIIDVWQTNCGACRQWNTRCPYHKLCTETDQRVIDNILPEYKVERWSPLPDEKN